MKKCPYSVCWRRYSFQLSRCDTCSRAGCHMITRHIDGSQSVMVTDEQMQYRVVSTFHTRSIESREPDTAICLPSSTSRQRTVKVWPRSTCLPLPDASRKHARSGCSHRSRRSRLCCQIEHAAAPLVYARRIARELRLGELSRLPASGSVLRLADYICGLAKDSPLRSTSSASSAEIS